MQKICPAQESDHMTKTVSLIGMIILTLSAVGWGAPVTKPPIPPQRPVVGRIIPPTGNPIVVETSVGPKATTLVPEIQQKVSTFIKRHGNPISGLVLVEVETGKILALTEGMSPRKWSGKSHTVFHPTFPSASLFKTVVASAAIELSLVKPRDPIGLIGGCGEVLHGGQWMAEGVTKRQYRMDLKKAYGMSCNGFFAKIAVNDVGLGAILEFANRFRWQKDVPADFFITPSPLKAPSAGQSSVHTIGRFAAGFGYVGSSPVHAAWRTLAIASKGIAKPLILFEETDPLKLYREASERVISEKTSQQLLQMMDATIRGGTASSAFRRGKHRSLRFSVGGKTGTLTGHNPEGLTTWFTGVYPVKDPKIVVASVVVIGDHSRLMSGSASWRAKILIDLIVS